MITWFRTRGSGLLSTLLKGTGTSPRLSLLICEMGMIVVVQPTSQEDDEISNYTTDGKGSLRVKA